MALSKVKHYSELIREGRRAETDDEPEKAASLYESALRQEPLEALPFNRLMIIYRKLGQPKDELRIIDKALELFQDHYDHKSDKLIGSNSKAAQLSRALARSVSGKNKDLSFYYPEPVPTWLKRRAVVEKKLVNTGRTKTPRSRRK